MISARSNNCPKPETTRCSVGPFRHANNLMDDLYNINTVRAKRGWTPYSPCELLQTCFSIWLKCRKWIKKMPETSEYIIHPLEWANRLCLSLLIPLLTWFNQVQLHTQQWKKSVDINRMYDKYDESVHVSHENSRSNSRTNIRCLKNQPHWVLISYKLCLSCSVSRGPVIASTFAVEERQHKFCECLSNLCEYPQHILMCSACELMYCFHIDQFGYTFVY